MQTFNSFEALQASTCSTHGGCVNPNAISCTTNNISSAAQESAKKIISLWERAHNAIGHIPLDGAEHEIFGAEQDILVRTSEAADEYCETLKKERARILSMDGPEREKEIQSFNAIIASIVDACAGSFEDDDDYGVASIWL